MDLIWSLWLSIFENAIYSTYFSDKPVSIYQESSMPLEFQTLWTYALKGKRVLVIHPFETSIRENYKLREKLFTNSKFLPEFELQVLKSVQSSAGNTVEFST